MSCSRSLPVWNDLKNYNPKLLCVTTDHTVRAERTEVQIDGSWVKSNHSQQIINISGGESSFFTTDGNNVKKWSYSKTIIQEYTIRCSVIASCPKGCNFATAGLSGILYNEKVISTTPENFKIPTYLHLTKTHITVIWGRQLLQIFSITDQPVKLFEISSPNDYKFESASVNINNSNTFIALCRTSIKHINCDETIKVNKTKQEQSVQKDEATPSINDLISGNAFKALNVNDQTSSPKSLLDGLKSEIRNITENEEYFTAPLNQITGGERLSVSQLPHELIKASKEYVVVLEYNHNSLPSELYRQPLSSTPGKGFLSLLSCELLVANDEIISFSDEKKVHPWECGSCCLAASLNSNGMISALVGNKTATDKGTGVFFFASQSSSFADVTRVDFEPLTSSQPALFDVGLLTKSLTAAFDDILVKRLRPIEIRLEKLESTIDSLQSTRGS